MIFERSRSTEGLTLMIHYKLYSCIGEFMFKDLFHNSCCIVCPVSHSGSQYPPQSF
jgi:hypothetical protein